MVPLLECGKSMKMKFILHAILIMTKENEVHKNHVVGNCLFDYWGMRYFFRGSWCSNVLCRFDYRIDPLPERLFQQRIPNSNPTKAYDCVVWRRNECLGGYILFCKVFMAYCFENTELVCEIRKCCFRYVMNHACLEGAYL